MPLARRPLIFVLTTVTFLLLSSHPVAAFQSVDEFEKEPILYSKSTPSIGAMISVSLVQTLGPQPWVMALAVSTTITITKLTRTVHPPSGAVALVGVLANVTWDFLFAAVLAGSIVMVLWTCLFNRLACKTTYPEHWL